MLKIKNIQFNNHATLICYDIHHKSRIQVIRLLDLYKPTSPWWKIIHIDEHEKIQCLLKKN